MSLFLFFLLWCSNDAFRCLYPITPMLDRLSFQKFPNSVITGGGISGALPDTLMDDYAQTTFVPARAQGQWQEGLLAFYDKVFAAEQDPTIAQEWQTKHPQAPGQANPPDTTSNFLKTVVVLFFVGLALILWLGISAVVAARRRQNFFYIAFRLLGQFLLFMIIMSRNARGGSSSGRGGSWGGGSGSWGGGGSSPSSGGDV